ncbi:MAG: EAL domain-containing protein, partial [Solirubrobacteraceae bacterium]
LKRAHARGFRLALDDMGAGNAGLRALTHVRFDVVKLDRHVIARLGIDPASDATVAAATTFVQQTGGKVIAEGIEDTDMLDFLRRLEDDMTVARPRIHGGQGYGLGRPSHTIPPTTNNLLLDTLPA